MAVERGAKSWRMAVSPTEDFTHVVVDSEQWGMGKIITREQFRNILGIDSSTPGLIKAGTESAPVVLEPREQPGLYIAKGSPGYYSWDGIVEEAQSGFDWYLVWNDDSESWSLVDMGELPQPDIDKTDTVVEPSERVTTETAVLGYSTPLTSPRIFPSDFEVHEFDRPDLVLETPFIEIDKNGVLISPNINIDYSILENYGMHNFDRPDLGGVIEVDKNLRLISSAYPDGPQSRIVESLYTRLFHEPSTVEEFHQTDSDVIDYDEIIAKWDAIMVDANQQLEYVSRTEISRTSVQDLPIYRYDFTPANPKVKLLITTGMHGSEKIYIKLLPIIFNRIVTEWGNDPLLEWIRFNVHFIVVPVMSPSCTEGLVPGTGGGRRVHETDPIPVSWTKVGNTATVSFDTADFPNTNGRLDAASYFSNPNIVGKTWVSIFDSDNSALGNKGYVIKSVVNGNTITVQTDNEISGSGTAKLYVGVDINRNMQPNGSNIWNQFTPSTTMTMYSNDYVSNPNDNKGTKPFSLNESIVLKNLIDSNPDILFYLDLHSGAGNNYLHWNTKTFPGQGQALDEVMQHQGAFNSDGFSRVTQDATNIPYAYKYCVDTIDRPAFTIEWEQVANTTDKSATDAFRWMLTSIISLVRNLK